MSELKFKRDISPNFVNESSKLAEKKMHELVDLARDLGVEIFPLKTGETEIVDHIKRHFPQRYELVVQKLNEEGLSLSDLTKEILLDRLLGIDLLFTFQGKTYAVDVATGKHTTITNKEAKFNKMKVIYKELGIDRALIIRLLDDITEDIVLDLFSKLEELADDHDVFSIVIKYPETRMKKRHGHL